MPVNAHHEVTIRVATPQDSETCGQICYDAFSTINRAHGFPCDFPGPEAAHGVITTLFSASGFYCVVAENGEQIVGSNCLDERSVIRGVGPLTVNPTAQNRGAGRKLMQAVIDRAAEKGAAGIRLVQAAFHNRSLSLYTSLGFDVQEPLTCMQGQTTERSMPGCTVRQCEPADLEACNALSRQVHSFDRGVELAHAMEHGTARVVERGGRITAYTSLLGFFGHSTAETNLDMQALIAAADSLVGPGILVPTRNSALMRWCLANGLQVVQPLNLMSMGLYNEPAGVFLPSILY